MSTHLTPFGVTRHRRRTAARARVPAPANSIHAANRQVCGIFHLASEQALPPGHLCSTITHSTLGGEAFDAEGDERADSGRSSGVMATRSVALTRGQSGGNDFALRGEASDAHRQRQLQRRLVLYSTRG